jgi:hypothetical protein
MIYLVLTAVHITGLYFAGRKVWWAWFLPAGVQLFWFALTVENNPPEFIFASLLLLAAYSFNAVTWAKEKLA